MGQFFESIPDNLMDWLLDQKIFFVSTAPLSAQGSPNVSPKGTVGTFNITDPNHCWYQDLTGSGSETISHLSEKGNSRITIMFVTFDGPPRIVRFFGHGKAFFRGSPEYNALLPPGSPNIIPGSRAVISIDIFKVGSSCGFSIPYYDYVKERTTLIDWSKTKERIDAEAEENGEESEKGLKAYWYERNAKTIDGKDGFGTILKKSKCAPAKQGRLMDLRKSLVIPSTQTIISHLAFLAIGGLLYKSWLEGSGFEGLIAVGGLMMSVIGVATGVGPAPCCGG